MIRRERRPVTTAAVNGALRQMGAPERLIRANGYYYFAGGDAANWHTSAVMVNDVSDLTIGEWLDERIALAARDYV